jgi:hypothetical protein
VHYRILSLVKSTTEGRTCGCASQEHGGRPQGEHVIVELAVGGRVCQLLVVNDVGVEFLQAQGNILEDEMRPVEYDRLMGTHDLFTPFEY